MITNSKGQNVPQWIAYTKTIPFESETPLCPCCSEHVIPKNGKEKVPHFAHYPDSNCKWGAGMSQWHQRQQYNHGNVGWTIERQIPGTSYRADAFIEADGKIWVREFIHTWCEEYAKKNADLVAMGINVEWIVDPSAKGMGQRKNRELYWELNALTLHDGGFSWQGKRVDCQMDSYPHDYKFFLRMMWNSLLQQGKVEQSVLNDQLADARAYTLSVSSQSVNVSEMDAQDMRNEELRKQIAEEHMRAEKILKEIPKIAALTREKAELDSQQRQLEIDLSSAKAESSRMENRVKGLLEYEKERDDYIQRVEALKLLISNTKAMAEKYRKEFADKQVSVANRGEVKTTKQWRDEVDDLESQYWILRGETVKMSNQLDEWRKSKAHNTGFIPLYNDCVRRLSEFHKLKEEIMVNFEKVKEIIWKSA